MLKVVFHYPSDNLMNALNKIKETRYIIKNIAIKSVVVESRNKQSTITQRTSIRLTAYQWSSFAWICDHEGISQSELFSYIAQHIDWTVRPEHKYLRRQSHYSLSNTIRIFIIAYFRVLVQELIENQNEVDSNLEMDDISEEMIV